MCNWPEVSPVHDPTGPASLVRHQAPTSLLSLVMLHENPQRRTLPPCNPTHPTWALIYALAGRATIFGPSPSRPTSTASRTVGRPTSPRSLWCLDTPAPGRARLVQGFNVDKTPALCSLSLKLRSSFGSTRHTQAKV